MGLKILKEKSQLLKILFLSVFALLVVTGYTQSNVDWLTIEEAVEKSKVEKRKVFIDVYTDWCGWCKKMDKATFQKPVIAEYLNDNFYAVKFDAEQKTDIHYNDKVHRYVRSGKRGYNTLALELTKGRLSYPTIVFLDENFKVIQPIPGYRGPDEFEMIMTYFAGDHYRSTKWKTYQKMYVPLEKKMNKYSQPVTIKNH